MYTQQYICKIFWNMHKLLFHYQKRLNCINMYADHCTTIMRNSMHCCRMNCSTFTHITEQMPSTLSSLCACFHNYPHLSLQTKSHQKTILWKMIHYPDKIGKKNYISYQNLYQSKIKGIKSKNSTLKMMGAGKTE